MGDKAQEISSGKSGESISNEQEETSEKKPLYIWMIAAQRHCAFLVVEEIAALERNFNLVRASRRRTSVGELARWVRVTVQERAVEENTSLTAVATLGLTLVTRLSTDKKKMKWKTLARGKFEEMLLECIVNIDKVRPNYENILLDPKVVARVEQVIALGLTRPKAFSHGLLKNNKITGAIQYGPPGTGKILLARGVAKQSGFNMLPISTSEVWQKCHGDDEKMIKAIFLDEADAILDERKAGEKLHLRTMINKFLMEWNGITSGTDSLLMLLATNRPSDLDPAVLRRAPGTIGILTLLLNDERLGHGIDLSALANLTPQYMGSDPKRLCMTAANKYITEQSMGTAERILTCQNFLAAMKTIKSTAISKTREQDLQNFQNNRQEQSEE